GGAGAVRRRSRRRDRRGPRAPGDRDARAGLSDRPLRRRGRAGLGTPPRGGAALPQSPSPRRRARARTERHRAPAPGDDPLPRSVRGHAQARREAADPGGGVMRRETDPDRGTRPDERSAEVPERVRAETGNGNTLRDRMTRAGTQPEDGAAVTSWQDIKSRFVDDPAGAIAAAERLVQQAVEDRIRALRDEAAAVCAP